MIRPGSSLTKAKQNPQSNLGVNFQKPRENKIPELQDYVKNRDWVGAIAFLENQQQFNQSKQEQNNWLAYCYFHAGEYRKAIQIYDEMIRNKQDMQGEVHAYKACCLYALQLYDEAKRECLKAPEDLGLTNRLIFHLAHKKNDEKNLMQYHNRIGETVEDNLTLAAVHYLRGHYEEASEIYKKLLLENREFIAINVYVALCYYKMDFFDVSQDILQSYLSANPTSVIGVNLKCCNQYQMYNGKVAEQEMRVLQQAYEGGNLFNDFDLLRHNLVVFRDGENALQVLPPLIDVFPEARLNLVIYYLKNEEYQEAFKYIKDLEPNASREYILKGVVYAVLGQMTNSPEYLKTAQNYFQVVGASPTEQDTIPGRQSMASCFFLLKQFDDVLIYLNSIKSFYENDDDFNWNYAITCAATGDYNEAEQAFTKIKSERYKSEETYLKWLCRVLVMNGKAQLAWQLYINMENTHDSLGVLYIIANDCYNTGQFYYALKAFDIIERIDTDANCEEAIKGAVVGVFQMLIAGKESKEHMVEVLNIMKNALPNSPQVEYVTRIVMKWAKDNEVQI